MNCTTERDRSERFVYLFKIKKGFTKTPFKDTRSPPFVTTSSLWVLSSGVQLRHKNVCNMKRIERDARADQGLHASYDSVRVVYT